MPEDADEAPMEHIHHQAHQSHGNKGESWIGWAALTAAIFAAIAAIGGSLSSENLNDAGSARLKANDLWNQYQAKSIKQTVLKTKVELLEALDKPKSDKDAKQIETYDKEKEQLKEEADKEETEAAKCTTNYNTLEHGVTLFHISIAVVAIAVLSKRRSFWLVSIIFSACGAILIIKGFMAM